MQPISNIEVTAAVAAAASNPIRLRLLERLLAGPCIVGDLVEATGLGQAVVSKQLGLLRTAGWLSCDPRGRCREYRLADPGAVEALLAALLRSAAACAIALGDCPKLNHRPARAEKTESRR
jgi:ArsR family transcriptional regulator, cadmium/lead-responsive transcriptional repressor